MAEQRKIQLTDEQIKAIKEHNYNPQSDLSKLLTNLIFDLLEESDKREKKFWAGLYLLANVSPDTHSLTINYIDKCLYIKEGK